MRNRATLFVVSFAGIVLAVLAISLLKTGAAVRAASQAVADWVDPA